MKAALHDIGARLTAAYCLTNVAVTAGAGGDATEVNGAWIDVRGFESLKVLIPFTTALAASQTLTVAGNLQDAADIGGTGAADFGAALPATVFATGAGTRTGVVELDFDVSASRGFVRVQFTPNLSATGTDTAALQSVYVLGGAMRSPITASLV